MTTIATMRKTRRRTGFSAAVDSGSSPALDFSGRRFNRFLIHRGYENISRNGMKYRRDNRSIQPFSMGAFDFMLDSRGVE
jgi:hypothetical protein